MTEWLTISQIVIHNPVIWEKHEIRKAYLERLNAYIRAGGWNRRNAVKTQLQVYEQTIMNAGSEDLKRDISYYGLFLMLDVIHILWYRITEEDEDRIQAFRARYEQDYKDCDTPITLEEVLGAFDNKGIFRQNKILTLSVKAKDLDEKLYLNLIYHNISFMEREPFRIMITSTVSAGKSMFINSLIGSNLCPVRNMSCTSKICYLINKTFEDDTVSISEKDCKIMSKQDQAIGEEILSGPYSAQVGISFDGLLGKERIILIDTPGVNSSTDPKHRQITEKQIKAGEYQLLVYVLNATQLRTNDEDTHLEYIRKALGNTPILFLINKIDTFEPEDEKYTETVARQRDYLVSKGFDDPIICPISVRAGYLSKIFKRGNMSKLERKEFYHLLDKLIEMDLTSYYDQAFSGLEVADFGTEEEQLQKACGLAYVEKMITLLMTGGSKA